jgi:hypothetical protein
MLLTPEDVKIRRHVGSEQEYGDPILIPQTRASFTLSNLNALQQPNPFSRTGYSHLDIFGYFAIGVDPIAARDFDMSPVFYFYDAARRTDDYPLIASLVHALTETRELLSLLTLMEERSIVEQGESTSEYEKIRSQFPNAKIGLLYQTKERSDRLAKMLASVPVEAIAEVVPVFETDRRPFWNLVEAIDLLSGLLQAADSASLDAELLYFSQHEWRLTKILNSNGYSLSEDGDVRSKLSYVRRAMQRSIHAIAALMDTKVNKEWLRKCWVVLGSARTRRIFREYIRLVVCPENCRADVERIVEFSTRGNTPPPLVLSV